MRVKRGITTHAKHKKLMAANKGYRMTKRRLVRTAKQAFLHAGEYAFAGRKNRKRDFRQLWITRISEAVKLQGLSYSKFMAALAKANIALDRKMLSYLVTNEPTVFTAVVDKAKAAK